MMKAKLKKMLERMIKELKNTSVKWIAAIAFLFPSLMSDAQVEMADNFRGEGKIYVVVTVILVLLTGFFILLFKLDKRSKKLEKEIMEK